MKLIVSYIIVFGDRNRLSLGSVIVCLKVLIPLDKVCLHLYSKFTMGRTVHAKLAPMGEAKAFSVVYIDQDNCTTLLQRLQRCQMSNYDTHFVDYILSGTFI